MGPAPTGRAGLEQLEAASEALARAVEDALPAWVERCVGRRLPAGPAGVTPGALEDARRAGELARAEVGVRLRALLAADVDDQRTTPLAILREAVGHPTAVLRRHGVAPVARDRFAEERFPDDAYDLTPASLADLGPAAGEAGLAWGAAKAFVHLRRHGGGGPAPPDQPRQGAG